MCAQASRGVQWGHSVLYPFLCVLPYTSWTVSNVMVSCMIFREPMSLLKPFYRNCVGMASYVHNRMYSSSVHALSIDCWSRDATSPSIIAHLLPGLHLHFYLSTPLPDIVIVCSPLHDFHVLMDPSASVLNTSLN